MKTGSIYKFVTAKARGHVTREKYHIFIDKDQNGKSVFLFINSENYFNEGFELKKSDYSFFSNPASFIGCTSTVSYTTQDIQNISEKNCVGVLKKEHIEKLENHILNSEVLELGEIKFICAALRNIMK